MSAIPQTVFDADAYKETTRRQWDKAADAWHHWGPLFSKWLGPATEQMLDMADVRPGSEDESGFAGPCEMVIASGTK
jgi:hypothetical protein